jgi:hypothetical protein
MATMYPSHIDASTKSPGEIEIFNRLKNDPGTDNWVVLHSLDIAEHQSQIAGELDFVVIIPGKGVLCLEVKATSRIRRENGLWYYGKDVHGDARGPFKQASEGMHSLRKKVVERVPALSKVFFWSAVILPYIHFDDKSPEWHEWQIIDKGKFTGRSISTNLLHVINQARDYLENSPGVKWFNPREVAPSLEQCQTLTRMLRPSFEYYESPSSRISRRQEELRKYTEDQYEAIDAMVGNPRVIFQGPAGTGKTLLALEAARRSTEAGKKTLLICYNKLLGMWIKNEVQGIENLTIGTLHSYMLTVAGAKVPDDASADFWSEELPNLALERLVDVGCSQFDQVIIDEAQDLLRDLYLDFLDLSIKGGISAGNWYFFGDFEKQAIYESSDIVSAQLEKRFVGVPRYSLRTNCRNSPRIAAMVHILGGLSPDYTKIRRPDNQIEPKIIVVTSPAHEISQISTLLTQLVDSDKYTLQEIVILFPHSEQESIVQSLPDEWASRISPLRAGIKPNKLHYGTIHSYKGLEAPVVILTGIEDVSEFNAQALFYTGITRAIEKLFILVSKKVSQEFIHRLLD